MNKSYKISVVNVRLKDKRFVHTVQSASNVESNLVEETRLPSVNAGLKPMSVEFDGCFRRRIRSWLNNVNRA